MEGSPHAVTASLAAVTVREKALLAAPGQLSDRLATEGWLALAVKQGQPVTARPVMARRLG